MIITIPARLIIVDLIILIMIYSPKSKYYEAPHFAVIYNFLLFYLSSIKVFFSAPNSQTPSVHVLALV
jgi:hypothetical protein